MDDGQRATIAHPELLLRQAKNKVTRVFYVSHFGSFYPQNLVLNPQNFEARVLSDAYMINPILILLIYAFVFKSIYGLKCKNYQIFWQKFTLKALSRPHSKIVDFIFQKK